MPVKNENVLSWASHIEENTMEQALRTSRLPFIHGHVALMPDAHWGFGSTVGSVIPTLGAIVPAAIGVDIGCGMIAAETDLTASGLPDDLDRLHGYIASVVPAGVGRGHESDWWPKMGDPAHRLFVETRPTMTEKQVAKMANQFGSLGAGNHFVEVCLDERDRVWVVLHSGSRGIGNELATQHIECAKDLMKRYFIDLEDKDLAYLIEGTAEFDAYIKSMLWAQEYAFQNRQRMMDAALTQLFAFVGTRRRGDNDRAGEVVRTVNCHHNFTEKEHHNGKDVWLTRKGAIRARTGDFGVIPGSMATGSYIVSGKGSKASYDSCSHGAGRRMSRGQARRELTPESLDIAMKGKAWNNDAKTLLDEHPDAYKDIEQVMNDQADLIQIEHRLIQVLNFKGA